ncbi:MAG: nitrile hydratase subunit alpha [Chromatiales bacterium]|jgi:nitrile hydratase subunit alpha|nr:nitrile hydratase subunit alpha [Chromatiales bacterium]
MTKHDSHAIADVHHELHSHLPPEPALRAKALESLLVEKGMVDSAAVDAWIEAYSEQIGPKNGARIIARSWVDAEFRARLLADASEAITDLELQQGHLIAIENTAELHNLVVCTLCSCYPMGLLGMAPTWYKTAAYRSRSVREPRVVLDEFGVGLSADIRIKVWDSTAELRYMVIPQRPAGTDGWDEEKLAELVTRNSMIGTERDLSKYVGAQS